ncbi:MAG: acyl-CoA thioesterase [Caulobacter sp.]|nr:acyl-CoA thioesterase [Caulobacter sp.]
MDTPRPDLAAMDAIYRLDGARVETSPNAAGPWDATMQHGSAPTALCAWAAEAIPTAVPMQVARLTIDLLRPVPVAPLDIETAVVREGKKIQLIAISLKAKGVEVARASVLKVRRAEVELPDTVHDTPPNATLPHLVAAPDPFGDTTANRFVSGLQMRAGRGAFRTPGPAAIWFKAERPIIEGEAITPLMRACITADFCNGSASMLPWEDYTFINGDLTVSLARYPVGDWVLLDAETWLGDHGGGVAFAGLADERGYFGRAVQSLVIEKR